MSVWAPPFWIVLWISESDGRAQRQVSRLRQRAFPARLLKCQDAAGVNELEQRFQCFAHVRKKLEDQPADNGVEQRAGVWPGHIRLHKGDVRQSERTRAFPGPCKCQAVKVYAHDLAGWSDQLRGEHRDIAHSTADIQHSHASADTSIAGAVVR